MYGVHEGVVGKGVQELTKVGDTIKCHDADDMIRTCTELAKSDIKTDFMYEKDGEKGCWLIVVDHY